MNIAHEKCVYHPVRSASGRCPECEEYYCRECITEHEDRVICANCLEELTRDAEEEPAGTNPLRTGLRIALGLFVCWFFYYGLAQFLLMISTPLQNDVWF